MQKPNFPNELYSVTMWPSRDGSASPVASWMAIPARYNQKTIATANGKRISLERLGKVEIIAESNRTLILRGLVRNKKDIAELVMSMHHKMHRILHEKLTEIEKQISGIQQEPIIRGLKYEP